MGKRGYAYTLYGSFERVYDLACEKPEAVVSAGLIVNLHMGVRDLLAREIDAFEFFRERTNILRACVIIGDEISGGVVLNEGDMIVVEPEEAHKPKCAAGTPCKVKKVVIKVKI